MISTVFEFVVEPAELFAERSRQFTGWGIPAETVARVRARVTDMWSGEATPVAVHVWRRPGVFGPCLLVLCGGVDTWKIELHRAALVATLLTGMTVAVVDMPGTGESAIPLAPDVDEVLAGVIAQIAERVRARRTAAPSTSPASYPPP